MACHREKKKLVLVAPIVPLADLQNNLHGAVLIRGGVAVLLRAATPWPVEAVDRVLIAQGQALNAAESGAVDLGWRVFLKATLRGSGAM